MWKCGNCKITNQDTYELCANCGIAHNSANDIEEQKKEDILKEGVAPEIEYDKNGYVKKHISEDEKYIVDLKPLMNWCAFSNVIGVISLIGSLLILAIFGSINIALGLTYAAISAIFSLFFFMIGKFLHKYCEVSINNTGIQKEILKTLKKQNR